MYFIIFIFYFIEIARLSHADISGGGGKCTVTVSRYRYLSLSLSFFLFFSLSVGVYIRYIVDLFGSSLI